MINIDEFQYEERVILFLDIIGWKEIIGQNNSVSDLMAEIIGYLVNHHYIYRTVPYKEKVIKKAEITGSKVNQLFLEVETAICSDNIIISTPIYHEGRLINKSGNIFRDLLALGVLSRGAITVGNLYHRENIVFGPAMNDVVELEKQAIYPRILCSDSLIEWYGKWKKGYKDKYLNNLVITDCLGRKVVNPFIPLVIQNNKKLFGTVERKDGSIIDTIESIKSVIKKNINSINDNKKLEKWNYIRSLMQSNL
ncbi:hypothetical protein Megpolyxen_01765 (plasmid) [Candidatus Megaera polyxenophila]|nr:hypothetical protein Megpolyxen_01765 [Candidatus Megaera polyxenophila]